MSAPRAAVLALALAATAGACHQDVTRDLTFGCRDDDDCAAGFVCRADRCTRDDGAGADTIDAADTTSSADTTLADTTSSADTTLADTTPACPAPGVVVVDPTFATFGAPRDFAWDDAGALVVLDRAGLVAAADGALVASLPEDALAVVRHGGRWLVTASAPARLLSVDDGGAITELTRAMASIGGLAARGERLLVTDPRGDTLWSYAPLARLGPAVYAPALVAVAPDASRVVIASAAAGHVTITDVDGTPLATYGLPGVLAPPPLATCTAAVDREDGARPACFTASGAPGSCADDRCEASADAADARALACVGATGACSVVVGAVALAGTCATATEAASAWCALEDADKACADLAAGDACVGLDAAPFVGRCHGDRCAPVRAEDAGRGALLGVAIDACDAVWVSESPGRLHHVDASGWHAALPDERLGALHVAPDGALWAVDLTRHTIVRLDAAP